jgi:hypothetical protein
MTSLYDLRDAELLGMPVVLGILRSTTWASVVDLARHYEMLKGRVQKEIVFVVKWISPD